MVKKIQLIGFLILIVNMGYAQITFIIDSLPDYTPPEDILYIAGDFQGWDPGDPAFALQKNADEKWFIQLESMPDGTTIQYKFTRGDWGTVEKGINGEEIPNRQFTFGNGDTVSIIIFNWADGGGGNSTAADNVFIVDDEFYMPQFDRYRRIWIYLPPDYESSNKDYPVIYMHDGQNLFDAFTSFAGEWEVDETLNSLYDDGYAVPIVVGIDNGGEFRIDEYTPWPNSQYGGGDGDLYIQFIIEDLKPFIDENYRTLPDRLNTALWGSSLGGLISHYGALKHQDIFSKAGIFSPSYWFSDSVWTFTQQMGHQEVMRLYQMAGTGEGSSTVENVWAMHDSLTNLGFDENELMTKIITGGQHNEASWAADFGEAYLWLFQSYANDINEFSAFVRLNIFPDPVTTRLRIPDLNTDVIRKINIYDVYGCRIYDADTLQNNTIDVSGFVSGTYIIVVITDKIRYQGKFIKI